MQHTETVVVIGAGAFGLSTALELKQRGYREVIVLDRHVPPVPDGSSVDISRTIRFDYGDPIYSKLAKEAYDEWMTSPHYTEIFKQTPFVLASSNASGRSYIANCSSSLDALGLAWSECRSADDVKARFPELSGSLAPNFYGYYNCDAGWADAERAVANFRDRCIDSGVSFLSGARGTVTGFDTEASGKITSVSTESGVNVTGDLFVLAAGAWSSRLVSMHQSILATGQVLVLMKLSSEEMERYRNMPIYMNFSSGWFSFPPHDRSGYLKFAVHGRGYIRSHHNNGRKSVMLSSPPSRPKHARENFAPSDGVDRLRAGLKEVLPELASRPFDRVAVCWYTDTPTGDFIVDYHPDHANLLVATGGSGHGFKFLPVLGKYIVDGLQGCLSNELRRTWRFDIQRADDAFSGDGSRGGPSRREFSSAELAKL